MELQRLTTALQQAEGMEDFVAPSVTAGMDLRLWLARMGRWLFFAHAILAVTSAASAQQTFGNISTRAEEDPAEPFITGFVIGGRADAPILIRGVGPALSQFGVTNPQGAIPS
jgi:hypothetical protein